MLAPTTQQAWIQAHSSGRASAASSSSGSSCLSLTLHTRSAGAARPCTCSQRHMHPLAAHAAGFLCHDWLRINPCKYSRPDTGNSRKPVLFSQQGNSLIVLVRDHAQQHDIYTHRDTLMHFPNLTFCHGCTSKCLQLFKSRQCSVENKPQAWHAGICQRELGTGCYRSENVCRCWNGAAAFPGTEACHSHLSGLLGKSIVLSPPQHPFACCWGI